MSFIVLLLFRSTSFSIFIIITPLPEPVTVTLPLTNPEALEGSLVRIVGLSKAASELDAWAVPSTITVQDSSANTIDIRVANGSTASVEPAYPATVV